MSITAGTVRESIIKFQQTATESDPSFQKIACTITELLRSSQAFRLQSYRRTNVVIYACDLSHQRIRALLDVAGASLNALKFDFTCSNHMQPPYTFLSCLDIIVDRITKLKQPLSFNDHDDCNDTWIDALLALEPQPPFISHKLAQNWQGEVLLKPLRGG